MSTYLPAPPPPATPSPPDPTVPWSWTPPMPTWPPPTSNANGISYYDDDDSSSSTSTAKFGIIVGVTVGVLGIILAFGIWYKYLRKKGSDHRCSK